MNLSVATFFFFFFLVHYKDLFLHDMICSLKPVQGKKVVEYEHRLHINLG